MTIQAQFNLVFYDDVAVYGGHEAMTLNFVDALAANSSYRISFIYYRRNIKLEEQLKRLVNYNSIKLIPWEFTSKPFQGVRTLFSVIPLLKLCRLFHKLQADAVVVVQGSIESSSIGILSAKSAGIKVISYIPFGHSMKTLSARAAWLRDLINGIYYCLPDRFITISDLQQSHIAKNNVPIDKISVAKNFVNQMPNNLISKQKARQLLELPENKILTGTVGRVSFSHKGQDFLVKTVASHRKELSNHHFVIIGSGPDEVILAGLVSSLGVEDLVTCINWQADMANVYAALDAIVLPSHFEGVPLVMIEAVEYGLPVIATNVDGMAEFLPKEWLFSPGDRLRLVELLCSLKNNEHNQIITYLRENFRGIFNRQKSIESFINACTTDTGTLCHNQQRV